MHAPADLRQRKERIAALIYEKRKRENRIVMEDSLYEFTREAWSSIESSTFQDSWAIEALCEHLQAVTYGHIKRLLINFPPRCGKPVAHDSLVLTRAKGLVKIDQIIVGDEVLTHKGNWKPVTAVHRQGVLPILRVHTAGGRMVEAAPDHPFLTPNGWVEAGALMVDDVLGIVPPQSPCGRNSIPLEEARLLGYFVGDGHCGGTPNITCADDDIAADIIHCIRATGFVAADQSYRMANTGYMLRRISMKPISHAKERRHKGYKGPVRQWLADRGLDHQSSYTKMAPSSIMEGSDDIVAAFLGAYWSCDGFITARGRKGDGVERTDLQIGCDSVNQAFMRQVQTLLARLGINSHVRTKVNKKLKTKRQGDQYVSYSLTLRSQDDCYRFAQRIKLKHSKRFKLEYEYKRRFDFDRPIWGEVIVSVEEAGEKECLCLTVADDESFTANGFAVHNSSVASICWPAWTWAQPEERRSFVCGPGTQFLTASYNHALSLKLSTASRRLILSPFYQEYWGDRFKLAGDQNSKTQYDTDQGGTRISTSIGGSLIGIGGAVLLADDPHNTESVESEAERETVLRWWKEFSSTRLNDPNESAIVVVMQRLNEADVSGVILESSRDWTHLMLPMRYDETRHCRTLLAPGEFWEDPRKDTGESLMWPERFGAQKVKEMEDDLGPYMASGRLQQRPSPQGGGILKREWWKTWEEPEYPYCYYKWASADTAYTEAEENDPTGFTVWGLFEIAHQPHIILMDAWRKRLELHIPQKWEDKDGTPSSRLEQVKSWQRAAWAQYKAMQQAQQGMKPPQISPELEPWSTYIHYGISNADRWPDETYEMWRLRTQEKWGLCEWIAHSCRRFSVNELLIEAKATGITVAQELRRLNGNDGWGIQLKTPQGDKVARAYAVQSTLSSGLVYAPDKAWADLVLEETSSFPKHRYKDLTDSTSMAWLHVREMGMLTRPEERLLAEQMAAQYRPQTAPLYPGSR